MQIDFNLKLESDHLLLRPLLENDLNQLLELTQEPDMWKFYTHDLSHIDTLSDWARPAFKRERLQFVIIDKATNTILGSSAFGNYALRDRRIEIGWTWLAKSHQGSGINAQVKQIMLTYAFEKLYMERVEFKTDVLNSQARKALRNIGAIEEGVLRSHTLMTKERRRDTIYYSILKSEWIHIKRENDW
ncbi:GNAT family N-acetyltransferase [Belliella pelovolcani]|uniref:GNAT family N-acetyltransferase n=1 Tax=Belliella pelovolcani TaxID=529505 RepID=UPI00391DE953